MTFLQRSSLKKFNYNKGMYLIHRLDWVLIPGLYVRFFVMYDLCSSALFILKYKALWIDCQSKSPATVMLFQVVWRLTDCVCHRRVKKLTCAPHNAAFHARYSWFVSKMLFTLPIFKHWYRSEVYMDQTALHKMKKSSRLHRGKRHSPAGRSSLSSVTEGLCGVMWCVSVALWSNKSLCQELK